jgi:predicted DNA-binding transcriptional regulator AlpA
MTSADNNMALPARHHLDRRAGQLAEQGAGDADDLLATDEVAAWLGVSTQFLEIARHRGYGPKFIRLSPRRTRYLRADVIEWLRQRTHACTSEYHGPADAA